MTISASPSSRVALAAFAVLALAASAHARNVIIMIGDGMGPEQVKAGGIFENGTPGTLAFEALPHTATATTYSADNAITDSAASGTAMATGTKVNNGVISIATPGDGSELQTLLENCKARGMAVGLVTTTYMTHATPAAFGAHDPSRNNTGPIASDYLGQTKPMVLLGGGANGMTVAGAQGAGYTVVTDRAGLQGVNTATVGMLSGQFGSSHLPYEYDGVGGLPHLSEMVAVALDVLDDDPDGFFLMIEGGRIDHACHDNDVDRAVREVVEFDNAFDVVWSHISGWNDTLLILTADHETGGMTVTANNGAGVAPTVTWSTLGHTATNVDVYAWGLGADAVTGALDNTDVHDIAIATLDMVAPSISSTAPTAATVGVAYSYAVVATGNPAPTVSVSGDPAWLTLSGSTLSGTPSASGATGTITVTASNGVSPDATQAFSIAVSAPAAPAITVTAPATGATYWGKQDLTIAWAGSAFSGTVDLTYTTDGSTWNPVSSGEAVSGSYSWQAPNVDTATLQVRASGPGGVPADESGLVTVVAITDVDGDRIDDAWEAQNFTGTGATDGTGDADGDGANDLTEFWNGTDPNASDVADSEAVFSCAARDPRGAAAALPLLACSLIALGLARRRRRTCTARSA